MWLFAVNTVGVVNLPGITSSMTKNPLEKWSLRWDMERTWTRNPPEEWLFCQESTVEWDSVQNYQLMDVDSDQQDK
jgi:hypothetical protein